MFTVAGLLLPIFTYTQYAPVDPPLADLQRVSHEMWIGATTVDVKTDFLVRLPNESIAAQELVLTSRQADAGNLSLVLSAVAIGNQPASIAPVSGHPGSYSIHWQIPTPQTIRVSATYQLQEIDPTHLTAIDRFQLLEPARVVTHGRIIGYDLRQLPDDFLPAPVSTDALVHHTDLLTVLGSAAEHPVADGTWIEPVAARDFGVVIVPSAAWTSSSFNISGAQFAVLQPKTTAQFDLADIVDITAQAWPKYLDLFGRSYDHVVIAEDPDQPMGGGPIASAVIALGAACSISPELQAYIQTLTGVPPLPNTEAYVDQIYAGSPTGWRDYLATILVHEIGHFYFGFGRTGEAVSQEYQPWFSLGGGIVYDEAISTEITGHPAALYDKMESFWRTKFANDPKIDQRLTNPDTTNDAAEGLMPFHRVQLYAHIKAARTLAKLRQTVGPDLYDALIKDYIRRARPFGRGYEDFRETLAPFVPNLADLEKSLEIR
jgi:hypothetical protein